MGTQAKQAPNGPLVIVTSSLEADVANASDLQGAGFEVCWVKTPSKAVDIVESKPKGWKPTIFIVDTVLTESSGFEIVRRLSAKYASLGAPIIMMSKYKCPEDLVEATTAGASTLIMRPLKSKDILDVLEKERMKKLKAEIGTIAFNIDNSH